MNHLHKLDMKSESVIGASGAANCIFRHKNTIENIKP